MSDHAQTALNLIVAAEFDVEDDNERKEMLREAAQYLVAAADEVSR